MQAKDIFIKVPISEMPEEAGYYILYDDTDLWSHKRFWNGEYWQISEQQTIPINLYKEHYTYWLLPRKEQYVLSYEEMNEFVRQMRIVRNHEASGINKFTYPKFDHYLKAHPQPYNQTPEEDREVRGF